MRRDSLFYALTAVNEATAPAMARSLVARLRDSSSDRVLPEERQAQAASRAIIEMVITIMVYKFTNLSRREVEAMLGLALQKTRVYQEAKAEGREEGREEGRQQAVRSLILRQLTRRVGTLSKTLETRIVALSLEQLEALAEALLDFQAIADLERWLKTQPK